MNRINYIICFNYREVPGYIPGLSLLRLHIFPFLFVFLCVFSQVTPVSFHKSKKTWRLGIMLIRLCKLTIDMNVNVKGSLSLHVALPLIGHWVYLALALTQLRFAPAPTTTY